jgi:hypothetical protein
MAKDGSETRLTQPKAFCAQNGAAREVKLEFKRYETHEDKMRELYRPKGLSALATAARATFTQFYIFSAKEYVEEIIRDYRCEVEDERAKSFLHAGQIGATKNLTLPAPGQALSLLSGRRQLCGPCRGGRSGQARGSH